MLSKENEDLNRACSNSQSVTIKKGERSIVSSNNRNLSLITNDDDLFDCLSETGRDDDDEEQV